MIHLPAPSRRAHYPRSMWVVYREIVDRRSSRPARCGVVEVCRSGGSAPTVPAPGSGQRGPARGSLHLAGCAVERRRDRVAGAAGPLVPIVVAFAPRDGAARAGGPAGGGPGVAAFAPAFLVLLGVG